MDPAAAMLEAYLSLGRGIRAEKALDVVRCGERSCTTYNDIAILVSISFTPYRLTSIYEMHLTSPPSFQSYPMRILACHTDIRSRSEAEGDERNAGACVAQRIQGRTRVDARRKGDNPALTAREPQGGGVAGARAGNGFG